MSRNRDVTQYAINASTSHALTLPVTVVKEVVHAVIFDEASSTLYRWPWIDASVSNYEILIYSFEMILKSYGVARSA